MSNSLAEELNNVLEEGLDVLESEASEKDESETNTGCSFTDVIHPVAEAFEALDAFTQSRMLQDIGRGIIGAIGWNRAFKENVIYGNYETAQGLQGGEKDDCGVYIGAYGEQELTPEGRPITSLLETLSSNQLDLIQDLEDKEDLLWNAYDKAEEAYRDLQGDDNAVFIRPSQRQRAEGIRSLEDMVEAQKTFAINWNVQRQAEEEAKRNRKAKEVLRFTAQERSTRRAMRHVAIV